MHDFGVPRLSALSIRDAGRSDWPTILALNEEAVHFLSPMDEALLAKFAEAARYLRVIDEDGALAAFLLAFRKGDDYAGTNFAWFAARFDDFLYVDRVVVAPAFRGRKLADVLYDDLETFARGTGVSRLTCEVNIAPPNPVSLRFHARRGFREVGQVPYAAKTVAMLACEALGRGAIRRL
ncbi:MAG TPA: GNAT family N-acetyltransferase [Rhizomicrobium sp.]